MKMYDSEDVPLYYDRLGPNDSFDVSILADDELSENGSLAFDVIFQVPYSTNFLHDDSAGLLMCDLSLLLSDFLSQHQRYRHLGQDYHQQSLEHFSILMKSAGALADEYLAELQGTENKGLDKE